MMTIKYAGHNKEGVYWYQDDSRKKYFISAKSDAEGNFQLTGKNQKGHINVIFHGIMKNGVVKGIWETGQGKKAFAFYVKAIK